MSYGFLCATSRACHELSPAVMPGLVIAALVDARDARNVPGRRTYVSDAAWLADLGAHELVRASSCHRPRALPPPSKAQSAERARTGCGGARERSTREASRTAGPPEAARGRLPPVPLEGCEGVVRVPRRGRAARRPPEEWRGAAAVPPT